MKKEILELWSKTVRRRVPALHLMACRAASNVPLFGIHRVVRGRGNRIALGASLLRGTRIDIVGEDNSIEIDDDCFIEGALIRIRGDGHRVRIGAGCRLGPGTSLWLEDSGGTIDIGPGTSIESAHLAVTEPGSSISIGRDGMFASGIDVRTGDSHAIFSRDTGGRLNPAAGVIVGDHVWVAARAILLKGVVIGDHSVVATGSIVTKPFPEEGLLIAGNPACVVKSGVTWTRERAASAPPDLT